jgi:hypothetical protein
MAGRNLRDSWAQIKSPDSQAGADHSLLTFNCLDHESCLLAAIHITKGS